MAGPAGGPLGNLPAQLNAVLPQQQQGGGGGASRHLNPMQFGKLGGAGEAAGGEAAAAGGEAAAGASVADLAPLALLAA